MAGAHRGKFTPKNPAKYIASNLSSITYRSSWEQSMMMVLDNHPDVIGWASEAIKIPYYNPFSRRGTKVGGYTFYVPDFFIVYIDRNQTKHQELIEIKPQQELPGFTGKVSRLIEARQALNMLKWKAAMAFCASRNWRFRICTEVEMFGFKKRASI